MNKFIATLNGVCFDINGGEYSQSVNEELFLGIIEANNIEEANNIAKMLEQKCYEEYYGNHKLNFPNLVVKEIEAFNTLTQRNFVVDFIDFSDNNKTETVSVIIDRFSDINEIVKDKLDEITNHNVMQINSVKQI